MSLPTRAITPASARMRASRVAQDPSKSCDGSPDHDYSQSIYDKFSPVDRQTPYARRRPGAGSLPGLAIGSIQVNIRVLHHSHGWTALQFLDLYWVSPPSLSGLSRAKWFARAGYVYSDKTIHDRWAATPTNAGGADVYSFMRIAPVFYFGCSIRNWIRQALAKNATTSGRPRLTTSCRYSPAASCNFCGHADLSPTPPRRPDRPCGNSPYVRYATGPTQDPGSRRP